MKFIENIRTFIDAKINTQLNSGTYSQYIAAKIGTSCLF